MNKFDNIENFMKETGCEIHCELRKMYFDDGEWIVMARTSRGSKYHVIDRFLDLPNAIEEALRCLNSAQQSVHLTLGIRRNKLGFI